MPTVRNRCRERGQTEDRWLVQVLSVALGLGHAAGKGLESLPLEGAAACAHWAGTSPNHGFAKPSAGLLILSLILMEISFQRGFPLQVACTGLWTPQSPTAAATPKRGPATQPHSFLGLLLKQRRGKDSPPQRKLILSFLSTLMGGALAVLIYANKKIKHYLCLEPQGPCQFIEWIHQWSNSFLLYSSALNWSVVDICHYFRPLQNTFIWENVSSQFHLSKE